MWLHYLVKSTTCYYCTVNNKFHAVPNDQQSLLPHFEPTTGRYATDIVTGGVYYQIEVAAV